MVFFFFSRSSSFRPLFWRSLKISIFFFFFHFSHLSAKRLLLRSNNETKQTTIRRPKYIASVILQNLGPRLVKTLHNNSHDLKSLIGGEASKVSHNISADKAAVRMTCTRDVRVLACVYNSREFKPEINIAFQKYA